MKIMMHKQLLILKFLLIKIQNQLLILKFLNISMHKQVLILGFLKISMHKQVLILKCQLQQLEMMEKHIIQNSILLKRIYMSKILIKMIIIYGRPFMGKWVHLNFQGLNYLLKRFLINVKSIQMSHTTFHLKSRGILKPLPQKKFYMKRWL